MVIKVGDIKLDLNGLKGMNKITFNKKFKTIFANPDLVYESIKEQIPKQNKK